MAKVYTFLADGLEDVEAWACATYWPGPAWR